MVGDVLNTIDLNPIVATLGNSVSSIVGNLTDDLSGSSSSSTATKRDLDYNLAYNILYSVNDYTGSTHTNRILAQNGSIYDSFLDNDGNEHGQQVVGYYSRDMSFTGHNRTITIDGQTEFELQYEYKPFPGLDAIANIYVTPNGQVVKTQVIAEAEGGGTSTVSDDSL